MSDTTDITNTSELSSELCPVPSSWDKWWLNCTSIGKIKLVCFTSFCFLLRELKGIDLGTRTARRTAGNEGLSSAATAEASGLGEAAWLELANSETEL